jgi:hypothetical protein
VAEGAGLLIQAGHFVTVREHAKRRVNKAQNDTSQKTPLCQKNASSRNFAVPSCDNQTASPLSSPRQNKI